MPERTTIPVRSFRMCFKLERRIHKIDRWRIPLPFGIPLRGTAYALGLLLFIVFLNPVPLVGDLLNAMPAPLHYLVLPIGGAYLLNMWELDGRPAHATGLAFARMRLGPRRLAAFRPAIAAESVVALGDITVVPDDRSSRLRPAIVQGPAELIVRYPFAARERGRKLELRQQDGPPRWRGKQIHLQTGQRVVIR